MMDTLTKFFIKNFEDSIEFKENKPFQSIGKFSNQPDEDTTFHYEVFHQENITLVQQFDGLYNYHFGVNKKIPFENTKKAIIFLDKLSVRR